MRLFIAIELSEEARRHLAELQEKLRRRIGKASWTKTGNLHLTLKFLGEVPPEEVTGVCDALGTIAGRGAFELRAEEIWRAPASGAARVLGVKLGGAGEEDVMWLYDRIEDKCARLGFDREKRRYSPHVTIARQPAARDLGEALAEAGKAALPGPGFRVEEFVLMQSHLRPEGSEYIPLARFRLGK